MKRAEKFVIPNSWRVMFNDLGISLQAALGYASYLLACLIKRKSNYLRLSTFNFGMA
ncbi:hypothetical protein JCM19233_356 [Vibrio astriarenae]|nr:hypothetical protein JCM19233_356 [Vibrio sp. C7]